MSSQTTTARSQSSPTPKATPVQPRSVNRLYFHLIRGGLSKYWCGAEKWIKTVEWRGGPLYIARRVSFDQRKYLTIDVIIACIDHIPGGSWVEGISKSDRAPDPEGDRAMQYWARKLGIREAA